MPTISAVELNPTRNWSCPECLLEHVTREAKPHTPFHNCARMRGLSVPFLPADRADSHLVAVEREDYMGSEKAPRTMAVRVDRADGSNDIFVNAPLARAFGSMEE